MNCSIFELENKSPSFEVNKAFINSPEQLSIDFQETSIQEPLGISTTYRATTQKEIPVKSLLPVNYKQHRKTLDKIKKAVVKHNLVSKRISFCGCPVPNKTDVLIHRDNNNNSKIKNIVACGSVWECPTCSNKILSTRQEELNIIGKGWLKDKGSIYLITFTIQHSSDDSLEYTLGDSKTKGITLAYSMMLKHRRFKEYITNKYGLKFSVRGLECTYGVNGFHVHIHSLFYLENSLTDKQIEELKRDLFELWLSVCKNSRLKLPNFKHGIDIVNGSNAGKYIAKWSSSNELSSPTHKKGKNGNFTIWQLQNFLINPDESPLPVERLKAILKEYYSAFKGKKLLTWSDKNKIRKKYLEVDKTDIDIVDCSDIESIEQVELSKSLYNQIRNKDILQSVKDVFELMGFNGLYSYLKGLNIDTKHLTCLENISLDTYSLIEIIKYNYGFFPDVLDIDKNFLKYCALNYIKLLDICLEENINYSSYGKYGLYVRKFCYQFQKNLEYESS